MPKIVLDIDRAVGKGVSTLGLFFLPALNSPSYVPPSANIFTQVPPVQFPSMHSSGADTAWKKKLRAVELKAFSGNILLSGGYAMVIMKYYRTPLP